MNICTIMQFCSEWFILLYVVNYIVGQSGFYKQFQVDTLDASYIIYDDGVAFGGIHADDWF